MRPLIIFGTSSFAEIAYEYFTKDSDFEVVAFTVSKEYKNNNEFLGLPLIAFEEVKKAHPPTECCMFIALTYNQMNRIRHYFYNEAKTKGYELASYISTHAFVWDNVTYGDNVFVFEDNTIQPFVRLGANVIAWSGNHIGHHSRIGDNCFISSHVVVSGHCDIGVNCFIGVNATIANNVIIGKDSLIGAGTLIAHHIPEGSIVKGVKSSPDKSTTYAKYINAPENE